MKLEYSREKLSGLLGDREKILGFAIIIFTLIIATSIYKSQTRKLESLNIKKDAEIKKNKVLNEIRQSEERVAFYRNLLNEKEPASITDKINEIARDSGVRIISIRPGSQEQQPLYIKYPFTVIIGADSYHTVGKFISKIESFSDVYFVDTINIKSTKENQLDRMPQPKDKLIINLTLSIIAFTG